MKKKALKAGVASVLALGAGAVVKKNHRQRRYR